jgi:hypothetical protein
MPRVKDWGLRQKDERLFSAKKATSFVNQLFFTGPILALKMAF